MNGIAMKSGGIYRFAGTEPFTGNPGPLAVTAAGTATGSP